MESNHHCILISLWPVNIISEPQSPRSLPSFDIGFKFRCSFNCSKLHHKLGIISYCFVLYYFTIQSYCVYVNSFIRRPYSLFGGMKKKLPLCVGYISYKNYLIALGWLELILWVRYSLALSDGSSPLLLIMSM